MIGTQVQQFKILEKIGEGGMGEVYLAEDTRLERKVALKFLPPHYSQDPDFKARFEHEAKAAAALNHPNIITVHELGEHEGRLYIAMERVEGQTLESLIAEGSIDPGQAIKIAQQICEGLSTAHEAGIIHRDIKPANILISKNGHVKILDFGLAKSRRATTTTRVGTTVGTIQYESPEQGRGADVDQRSDLFSLGVVLYEMITSQRPFQGEFEDAIRYAIANENPEPLARYKSDVPEDLQRVVSRLLEKDPDLRYQTATGVTAELKLLLRDSGPRPSGLHSAAHSAAHPAVAAPSKKGMGRVLIPASVVVGILALLLVFKPWNIAFQTTQEATAAEDRLAVMYFDNLTDPDDTQRQGEIVSSLLISDLSESQYLQVVSSQRLYDILKNLGKEGTRTITPDVATEVAHKAHARWMLTGRILSSEPNWVLSAELSDVATGDLIASPSVSGQPGERIFEVVDRLTAEIRGRLALPAEALAEVDKPVIELTTESTEAYRLYLEGREFANQFLYAEAEEKYRQAVEVDSTFAMAYVGIAVARFTYWRDFRGARENFQQAATYVDHATERDRMLIFALSAWSDLNFDLAIERFEAMIERYPEDKEAHDWLGALYQNVPTEHRDLDKAIAQYLRVVEIDPMYATAYNALAYAYDELGDFEQSIEAINKYIELAPNEPNPLDSRGELYANNGQVDKALESYLAAIEIKPDFLLSVRAAIAIYIHLGQYAEAEELIDGLLSDPNPDMQSRGRSRQVEIALHKGPFREAIQRLTEHIEIEETLPDHEWNQSSLTIWRSWLHAIRRDFAAAQADVARAQSLRQAVDTSWGVRLTTMDEEAQFYARSGEFDKADSVAALMRPHVGSPDGIDSLAFFRTLGRVRFGQGQFDSALVYLKAAAGQRWTWHELVWIGRAYDGARRLRDAERVLEQAVDMFDDSRWGAVAGSVLSRYWLGIVYEKSGKANLAIEQYREFLRIWKDADPDLEELGDARKRLAALQT